MPFTSPNCAVLLQDWVGSSPILVLEAEPRNAVDHFANLGSLISPVGLAKERLLPTSDIYGAVVTSAYLSRAEYTMRQCVQSCFMDPRLIHYVPKIVGGFKCLTNGVSSITRVWWEHRISNAEVRWMVFGSQNARSIDELEWLNG